LPWSLTDSQQHRRRKAVAEVLPTTPFLKGLGIVFERYEPDDVTVSASVAGGLANDGAVFTEITAKDSDGTVVAHAVQTYRIARSPIPAAPTARSVAP
jgi:acyl-coenzyme A thioesterase PaaI-like protein